jgi:hypothetical protein
MSAIRRAVAYAVTPGDDAPKISYHGVVSPDLLLSPALAVAALRIHQFPLALVRITDTAVGEIHDLWQREIPKNCNDLTHYQT